MDDDHDDYDDGCHFKNKKTIVVRTYFYLPNVYGL